MANQISTYIADMRDKHITNEEFIAALKADGVDAHTKDGKIVINVDDLKMKFNEKDRYNL